MAQVAIRGVGKHFGGTTVIHGVDIEIPDGDFAVLVGPVGLRQVDAAADDRRPRGDQRRRDRRSAAASSIDVAPKERDIAMVFQNYALYPHMTVRDNMSFSLRLANATKAEIDERVARAADILGLGTARPLSAPALRRPAPACRDGTRDRARPAGVPVRRAAVESRCQAARGHAHRDQGTAPAAEDDLGVRHARPDRGDDDGRQDRRDARRHRRADGEPLDLYDRPANPFVAGFIGSPAMNFLPGTRGATAAVSHIAFPTGRRPPRPTASPARTARRYCCGVRPEHCRRSAARRSAVGSSSSNPRAPTRRSIASSATRT